MVEEGFEREEVIGVVSSDGDVDGLFGGVFRQCPWGDLSMSGSDDDAASEGGFCLKHEVAVPAAEGESASVELVGIAAMLGNHLLAHAVVCLELGCHRFF